MRRKILHPGATELSYEIREIVKVAKRFQDLGVEICWENIGDPIQKGVKLPEWMREIVSSKCLLSESYGYSPTKGVDSTREYLAKKTNEKGGAQISSEDILFCNGLGDAISKVYEYLDSSARVIGPSPAYSTHSSAEGSHASQSPLTYNLNPDNHWYPDIEDLKNKIKYNPNVVGILIINPDNPTGMVYPEEVLREMVNIAREYGLFIIADEIYTNITYNGIRAIQLCEVIGDVCGISMKGISKEFPWPGSRCGWMEFYNTQSEPEFEGLVTALENAKMLEVCSTTLPQMCIPEIMGHEQYQDHRDKLNLEIEERGNVLYESLKDIPEVIINKTYGAFYNTIVFKKGVLGSNHVLKIENMRVKSLLEGLVQNAALDKRFVYYLLAQKGICIVPISSFCSELFGFRITLLETDGEKFKWICSQLKEAITEYIHSVN